MKILVTESQYNRILREEKEQKIFRVPGLYFFHEDSWEAWQILQKLLEVRGNPPYTIDGDLDFIDSSIESLGNLISLGGNLDLRYKPIKSLGNLQSVGGNLVLYKTPIKSLGNLISVGGDLYLNNTPIESLGNLISVGGNFDLRRTPLSEKYTEEEIRQMVDVGGDIYL
jgi:hypothetical protein